MNIPSYDNLDCGTLTGNDQVLPLLTENRQCAEVIVQADPTNGGDVTIGNDTAQWWVLEAGLSLSLPIRHIEKVYAHFPAGGTNRVNWIAMR